MDSWKIAVLGDSGVGKTKLIMLFTFPVQTQGYVPNPEEGPHVTQLVTDNRMCLIEVVDASARENNAGANVRPCDAFIFVNSIASRASFHHLEAFHQSIIAAHVGYPKPVLMLAGNKADLQHERAVPRDEGADRAREWGCEFVETSAKTAQNVEKLFATIVRKLRERKAAETRSRPSPSPALKVKKGSCIIM